MSYCVWTNAILSCSSSCLAKQRLHIRPLKPGAQGSLLPQLRVRGFSCQEEQDVSISPLAPSSSLIWTTANMAERCVCEGSFLPRNQGPILGAECWKYPDPDHPLPAGSWDNGSKPTEAKWETLRLLISLSPKSTKHPATGTQVSLRDNLAIVPKSRSENLSQKFCLGGEYRAPNLFQHKLESRLPGEISITSAMQMTPPLWQKVKKN